MLTEKRAREVVATVLDSAKKAGADEAEVHLGGGRRALTRFAGNEIHQNVEASTYDVSLRLVYGKRTARTSTTRVDAEGLAELVARTAEVTKLTPEDLELLPILDLKEAGEVAPGDAVDGPTDAFSAEERAQAVKKLIEPVSKEGYVGAGYFETMRGQRGTFALGNSKGVFRWFDRTSAGFSMTVTAKDSTGWCLAQGPRVGELDPAPLAARAVERAKASASPIDLEPGAYDVIMEPAGVQELMDFLKWGGYSGRAYSEGDTWSAGFLGKKVFGENITIKDDFSDPRDPGAPWDGEGQARTKLVIVDKGVLKELGWDRRSAKKYGGKPTGHGYRLPNLWGGGPENVIVDGGKTSIDEMVSSTKRGILLTRFWYCRLVDPKSVAVTGMTRDGTFLVEDGKVTRGIKNMR
ncbi:TldD/PmbA family protein, partial [bacterium]|nr:TldD/PmbA family protein [bacterium]